MARHLGPESARNFARREREGFFEKYLSGNAILDIGYRGADPDSEPITENAIGIELDYPGYDGKTLPFPDASQDAVFASHVLEHIEDWQGALRDWYRVLKVAGYLVIAVPHRDLYERKAELPSRFNGDHKRFYTPGSLLSEIEQALPVGGYRIRSLRDIDEGFDYSIPPERHAAGCYEIELVLEKIAIPEYADALRPSPVDESVVTFVAALLRAALIAQRSGRSSVVVQVQELLSAIPLPNFRSLRGPLAAAPDLADAAETLIGELRPILAPILRTRPFDEAWYLGTYPDVANAVSEGRIASGQAHYVRHGYFE